MGRLVTDLPDRRRFLRGALIAAASGTSMLASCSSASSESRTPSAASEPTGISRSLTLVDDGTDQSVALQKAIDSIPDGGTLLLPFGRYRIDHRITIRDRHNFTVSGPSATQPFVGYTDRTGLDLNDLNSNPKRRTSQRAHWLVSGGDGVSLRNLSVIGPNTERTRGFARFRIALAFEPAFAVRDSANNVTITSCRYENVYGDGIYIGGTGPPNRTVVLSDVAGSFSGRQGFAVVNVDGLRADRVRCDFSWGVGLDVEPNEGVIVRNLAFTELAMGAAHFPYSFGGPGDAYARQNISLVGCSAIRSGSKSSAIYARSPGIGLSIRNHVDERVSSEVGMQFNGWSALNVEASKLRCSSTQPSTAVQLNECTGAVAILNNEFSGFDSLLSSTGSPVVRHSGNHWNEGHGTD